VSVVVRKAYGAGLYAMSGPGFSPDATLALPTAKIAVMGPEAAVNAVYFNKIAEISDLAEREEYVTRLREEYEDDIDILRLAADLVIDAVVEPGELRAELIARLAAASTKDRRGPEKRHGVPPV
jgi:acetyl-CoA carboxylase carboxyltransferase component